jgi:uncharacterized protein (DUF1015 family)
VAPPYDVVGPADRARLAARSPYNAVHVDLTEPNGATDPYEEAAARLREWLVSGVLRVDHGPAFYLYRMGYRDAAGRARQTSGVIGAVELPDREQEQSPPVLPHERTLAKARDDRLRLLRASRANLSPVWCLSLATGLSELCEPSGPPLARCTDDEGVHHRLWTLTQPAVVEAIAATVASAPLVIADGHHRFETATAYRDERRREGAGPGRHDLVMALVVELAREQLAVQPIHRLLRGLPEGYDLVEAFSPLFELSPVPLDHALDPDALADLAQEAGGPVLLTSHGSWSLRWRNDGGGSNGVSEPDSAVVGQALTRLPGAQLTYEHRATVAADAVATGSAQAALLLRPASVEQIAAAARAVQPMPEKTTFFSPKPRTGMVFRLLS